MVASGFIGWFIVLLSVVALGLIIENFMAVTPEKLMPQDILEDLEEALDNGDFEEAVNICQSEDTMMTRFIGAGLTKMPQGIERMEDALAEELDAQATMLHQKLGFLNLIAGLAPMLGLMGTVGCLLYTSDAADE